MMELKKTAIVREKKLPNLPYCLVGEHDRRSWALVFNLSVSGMSELNNAEIFLGTLLKLT